MTLTVRVDNSHRGAVKAEFDGFKGKDVRVEVKEWHEKRSLSANAYMWVLIDKVADKLKQGKTEVYRGYIREVPGISQTVCVVDKAVTALVRGWGHNGLGWIAEELPSKLLGCTNVILYFGSSTFDTRQMSIMLDLVIQDCKELGIETMTPQELAGLVERWGDEKQTNKGA